MLGEGDERRHVDFRFRLSEDAYWFRERVTRAGNGEIVSQTADFTWHQLERARWFVCMIDFPRPTGGPPVVTHHYVRMHDQGGTFAFTHPDGRDMVFTMRHNYSYGMQRETFVIVVQDGDETGPTLVYAWTEAGAEYIGVNPGYLRIQCDPDDARHRRMQEWLRPDS